MSNISYRQNIIDKIDKQIEKGVNKYGQKLEDNNLTRDEKLTHLQEELIDALFYIEHLREKNKIKWRSFEYELEEKIELNEKERKIIAESLELYSVMIAEDVGVNLKELRRKMKG